MTDSEKIEFIKAAYLKLFKKDPPKISDNLTILDLGLESLRNMSILDLGIDSLDIVELQMEFENAYGVELPDPETDLKTVGNLLDHLNV